MYDDLKKIQAELASQRWGNALEQLLKLWEQCGEQNLPASLGPFLAECFQPMLDRPRTCTLLHAARAGEPQLKELLKRFRQKTGRFDSILLRAETIQLAKFSDDEPDDIQQTLSDLLSKYSELWKTPVWKNLPQCQTSLRPAGWKSLLGHNRRVAEHLEHVVKGSDLGWLNPAAAFLADTLLELTGGSVTPRADLAPCGKSWVLIAADDWAHTIPDPTGLVLHLRIEVIPDGCGAFYPHPDHAAHVVTAKTFQTALRNAWQVTLGQLADGVDARRQDYRWSLTVIDDSHEVAVRKAFAQKTNDVIWHRLRHLLLFSRLDGRSGEVALAAALKSAVDGIPLDLSRAATGHFTEEIPSAPNPLLHTILSVAQKDNGIEDANQALERGLNLQKILELVVSTGQEASVFMQRPLLETADFDGAWSLLSQYSKMTQAYKQHMVVRMEGWFNKECFGVDSYILNPMSRHGVSADQKELAKEECLDIVHGRHLSQHDRLRPARIFADSGIGKTTLLHWATLQIAKDHSERVPILAQGLKDFAESSSRDAFLREVCQRCLPVAISPKETDRWEWFQRKVRRGEVVFLLDALDQMPTHAGNIAAIVQTLPECPVLLTMRPESLRESESRTHRPVEWDTIELRPFTEWKAREYLKPYEKMFFKLLPTSGDDEVGSVLTIPLLLRLLRKFAEDNQIDPKANATQFDALRNRYAIYHHVITQSGGLIDKGFRSLKDARESVSDVFPTQKNAFRRIGDIALWLVRRNHFDTHVDGDLFEGLLDFLTELFGPTFRATDLNAALKQLDIVTALSIFDDPTVDGLTWRHRSFLEFFAGCRLAEMYSDPSTRADAIDVLRDVQRVLDDDGEFRQDLLHEDQKTCRDLPADWQWTLRFALAHATGKVRDDVAWQLIRFGNPWVVYDALEQDHLTLSEPMTQVCTWLVHRDWVRRDYRQAWDSTIGPPVAAWTALCDVGAETQKTNRAAVAADWLAELFDRSTRDGAFLHPLIELLTATTKTSHMDSGLADLSAACAASLEAYCQNSLAPEQLAMTFVSIPAGEFDPFRYHDKDKLEKAGITGPITIPAGLQMADFPVTNTELEWWCPTHRRWRDQFSDVNDQPAIHLSWYMAEVYCAWLTAQSPEKYEYRLPTEWEWESAARWGTTGKFWWGDEYRTDLMNCDESRPSLGRTNSRREARARFDMVGEWHPSHAISELSLLDLHGNVWEWCVDRNTTVGSSRVLRGGSWNDLAVGCRSAYRSNFDPDNRFNNIGFRVVCRLSCCECSQSSSN